jgi:outer membrane protein assembly factor BamB
VRVKIVNTPQTRRTIALLLIVLSFSLIGCGRLALRDSPKPVSYAVDANTSQLEVEWSYVSETLIRLGPLVAGELVMIMDRHGVVTAFDRASGEIVWQYESGSPVGVVSPATPKWIFHDDKLIFSVNSEKLVALNYRTGETIWETRFLKKVELPSMVIIDETVAIAEWDEDTYSYIGFYRLPDGQIAWHTRMPPRSYRFIFACPQVLASAWFEETVCVAFNDRTLVLDGRTESSSLGAAMFTQLPELPSYHTPVYQDGVIFINSVTVSEPYIIVYDAKSGEQFPLEPICDRRIHPKPVTIFGDQVLVANGCNDLHVADLADLKGERAWVYRSPRTVASRFVTLDGRYGYFLNVSVELVEIDLETGEEVGKIIMEPTNRLVGDQQWTDLVPSPPYLYAVLNGYTVFAFKQTE